MRAHGMPGRGLNPMRADPSHVFRHRGATFRLVTAHYGLVTAEIARQRRLLEEYLLKHPVFGESFEPVEAWPEAPECARRMAAAAARVGVGPMAAVAGGFQASRWPESGREGQAGPGGSDRFGLFTPLDQRSIALRRSVRTDSARCEHRVEPSARGPAGCGRTACPVGG